MVHRQLEPVAFEEGLIPARIDRLWRLPGSQTSAAPAHLADPNVLEGSAGDVQKGKP